MKLRFFKDNNTIKNNFDFKNREELYAFLQKKSITVFGWIIFVNLFKLMFFLSFGYIFDESDDLNSTLFLDTLLKVVDYFLIFLPLLFSGICVYYIYKVKQKNSFETLLKAIKNVKNALQIYVFTILIAYLVILYITIYLIIITSTNEPDFYNGFSFYATLILTCLVATIFILLILWLFYKITYSRFLKKLKSYYRVLINVV